MKNKHRPRDPDYRDIMKEIVDVSDFDPEMRMVIYGPPGSGKTTLFGTFPKPALLIDIGERGTDSIRKTKGVKVIRIKTWEDLDKIYWYLRKEKHGFKSVGIDTISGSQELSMLKVYAKNGLEPEIGKVGGWGTMRKGDWGDVSADLKSLIYNFCHLDIENVAFLAHERKPKTSDDDEDVADDAGIVPQVVPALMPSVVQTLNASVNIIGHTFIREHHRVVKLGKGKKKEKREVQHCLRLGPHAYYATKVRKPKETEAPPFIVNPTYDQLVELVEGDD